MKYLKQTKRSRTLRSKMTNFSKQQKRSLEFLKKKNQALKTYAELWESYTSNYNEEEIVIIYDNIVN